MRRAQWRLLMLLLGLLITLSLIALALRPDKFPYPPFRILPPHIRNAAEKALPGFRLNAYNNEIFGDEPAWELRGVDAKGHFQRLDISDAGEVLLIEPD